MSWGENFRWGKSGSSLMPVVRGGGASVINVSAINLVSPNTPAAVVACSSSSMGPLANNSTILNPVSGPGGASYYWISGDALWFKFARPVGAVSELDVNGVLNIFPTVRGILKGLNLSLTNQATSAFFASPDVSLFFQAMLAPWDPATLCWNNQPYNLDTRTDASGNKYITDPNSMSTVFAGRTTSPMKTGETFSLSGLKTTVASEIAAYRGIDDVASGLLLAGTTTTVRINQFPFDGSSTQILYKTLWNQNNNFIGCPITITPYAGDLSGRVAQTATITGYSAADGTYTFAPALPWTPAIGDSTHTDSAVVSNNIIYGAVLRMYARSSPLTDDAHAAFSASCAPFTGIQFFQEGFRSFQ